MFSEADTYFAILLAVQIGILVLLTGQTARLFDAFFTTKSDRLGLGLSLARAIVHMHGGEIWAEKSAGGGSAFLFTVPLTPKSETAAQPRRAAIH